MGMVNLLGNEKLAKIATGTAGTVYVMTGIKAIARPAFIYADKNSDAETKKYTAGKEFLYQVLCLGITVAMIPFFKAGGLKLAEKYLKRDPKAGKVLEELSSTKNIFKKLNIFSKAHKETKELAPEDSFKKAMTIAHGGIEVGSFVGSVLGLTILAPIISHEILHPIMKALGLEKKEKNVGKPNEIFLADAKVSTEKANKIDAKA